MCAALRRTSRYFEEPGSIVRAEAAAEKARHVMQIFAGQIGTKRVFKVFN